MHEYMHTWVQAYTKRVSALPTKQRLICNMSEMCQSERNMHMYNHGTKCLATSQKFGARVPAEFSERFLTLQVCMFVNWISYIPACMHTYIHTYARAYMRTYLHTNICLNPNTYKGASKHTNMGICTYARTHAYIDSDTHRTYTQTHKIQTYSQTHSQKSLEQKRCLVLHFMWNIDSTQNEKYDIKFIDPPPPPLPLPPLTTKHIQTQQYVTNGEEPPLLSFRMLLKKISLSASVGYEWPDMQVCMYIHTHI